MDAQITEDITAQEGAMVLDLIENLIKNTGMPVKNAQDDVLSCYTIALALLNDLPATTEFSFDDDEEEEGCENMVKTWGAMISLMLSRITQIRKGKNMFEGNSDMVCSSINTDEKENVMMVEFRIINKSQMTHLKKEIGKDNIDSLCNGCNKYHMLSALKSCGVCKNVKYCSVECQKSHWKIHKKICSCK